MIPSRPNRVLSPIVTSQLGLQNRVLRQLRSQGVQILATELQPDLTIVVDSAAGPALRRSASCITARRSAVGELISIWIDGVQVAWLEVAHARAG